jgi:hypothetical protein
MTKIDQIIPGGILPTDHVHRMTNDDTCSRCGKSTENEVPLMLWSEDGNDMLIFCDACLGEVILHKV